MFKLYVQTNVPHLFPIHYPKVAAFVETLEQGIDLVHALTPNAGDDGPVSLWMEDEDGTKYVWVDSEYGDEDSVDHWEKSE